MEYLTSWTFYGSLDLVPVIANISFVVVIPNFFCLKAAVLNTNQKSCLLCTSGYYLYYRACYTICPGDTLPNEDTKTCQSKLLISIFSNNLNIFGLIRISVYYGDRVCNLHKQSVYYLYSGSFFPAISKFEYICHKLPFWIWSEWHSSCVRPMLIHRSLVSWKMLR